MQSIVETFANSFAQIPCVAQHVFRVKKYGLKCNFYKMEHDKTHKNNITLLFFQIFNN